MRQKVQKFKGSNCSHTDDKKIQHLTSNIKHQNFIWIYSYIQIFSDMNIRSYHIGIVFWYQYIRIFIRKKLYTPEPLGPPGEEENPGEKTAALDAMFDPTTEPHPFSENINVWNEKHYDTTLPSPILDSRSLWKIVNSLWYGIVWNLLKFMLVISQGTICPRCQLDFLSFYYHRRPG